MCFIFSFFCPAPLSFPREMLDTYCLVQFAPGRESSFFHLSVSYYLCELSFILTSLTSQSWETQRWWISSNFWLSRAHVWYQLWPCCWTALPSHLLPSCFHGYPRKTLLDSTTVDLCEWVFQLFMLMKRKMSAYHNFFLLSVTQTNFYEPKVYANLWSCNFYLSNFLKFI